MWCCRPGAVPKRAADERQLQSRSLSQPCPAVLLGFARALKHREPRSSRGSSQGQRPLRARASGTPKSGWQAVFPSSPFPFSLLFFFFFLCCCSDPSPFPWARGSYNSCPPTLNVPPDAYKTEAFGLGTELCSATTGKAEMAKVNSPQRPH